MKKKFLLGAAGILGAVSIMLWGFHVSDGKKVKDKYDTYQLVEEKERLSEQEISELARKTILVCTSAELELADTSIVSYTRDGPVYSITYQTSEEANQAYHKFQKQKETIYCEYDNVLKTQEITSDQLPEGLGSVSDVADSLYHQRSDDANDKLYDVILPNMTEMTETGKKATIVVIDSGANGYKGYNVFTGTEDVTDTIGHGTRMIEIITSHINGVEYEIIPIKVANENGYATTSAMIKALEYASTLNPTIINISMTSNDTSSASDILGEYISKFALNGTVVVASAGNQGKDAKDFIPAKFKLAVVVGSCDENGNKKEFSNYGESVDYLVTSDSTSEAAAIMSAYYAMAYGKDTSIHQICGENGGIFKNYIYEEEGILPEEILSEDGNLEYLYYKDEALWWYCTGTFYENLNNFKNIKKQALKAANANEYVDIGAGIGTTFYMPSSLTIYDSVYNVKTKETTSSAGTYTVIKSHDVNNQLTDPPYFYNNERKEFYVHINGPDMGWYSLIEIQNKADEYYAKYHVHSSEDYGNYSPTCTATGWSGKKRCKYCYAITAPGQSVDALGHNFELSAWQYDWYGTTIAGTSGNYRRYKPCHRGCGVNGCFQYAIYVYMGDNVKSITAKSASTVSSTNFPYWYGPGERITITAIPEDGYHISKIDCLNSSGGKSSNNGSTWEFNIPKSPTYGYSFKAYATANQYTITYKGNGGKWDGKSSWSETVTYKTAYTTRANFFAYAGHTFTGWKEEGNDKADWTPWIGKPWTWTHTRNVTLVAQWTKNNYTITYDGNGGTWNGQKTWSETVEYGSSYITWDNFFTYPGHTFTGWKEEGNDKANWKDWIGKPWTWEYTKNVTLVAQWQITCTLDANGGSFESGKTTVSFNPIMNHEYGSITNSPSWDGHTFLGYFTQKTGGEKIYNKWTDTHALAIANTTVWGPGVWDSYWNRDLPRWKYI